MSEPTFGWTLHQWPGGDDSVVWIADKPGVPPRCICGAPFPWDTPPDADKITCEGGWRHVWRSLLVELEERIRLRTPPPLAKPDPDRTP